eukprot:COSAG06_NODE_134_length_22423_cov_17.315445_31_plen_113_part_00
MISIDRVLVSGVVGGVGGAGGGEGHEWGRRAQIEGCQRREPHLNMQPESPRRQFSGHFRGKMRVFSDDRASSRWRARRGKTTTFGRGRFANTTQQQHSICVFELVVLTTCRR